MKWTLYTLKIDLDKELNHKHVIKLAPVTKKTNLLILASTLNKLKTECKTLNMKKKLIMVILHIMKDKIIQVNAAHPIVTIHTKQRTIQLKTQLTTNLKFFKTQQQDQQHVIN